MSEVDTIRAAWCEIPGLPTKTNGRHAEAAKGKFYVKGTTCPKLSTPSTPVDNPRWIANELLYYVIGRRSHLEMPECSILDIEGKLYWGCEVKKNRNALCQSGAKEHDGNRIMRLACQDLSELRGLARAVLLDIALLNSDRRPWNILKAEDGKLCYFDHDKSLLGDGREPDAHPRGDLGRIACASVRDEKVGDYLACAEANSLILRGLSDSQISEIFDSLALDRASLKVAQESCPTKWLTPELFGRLERFLLSWWQLLREAGRLTDTPRCYLSHILRNHPAS